MKPYGKLYTLDDSRDWGANGTVVQDIKGRNLISAIFIRVQLTVATVSVMLDTLASTVSRVELVDGSRVLYSMSGEMAQAMAYYMTGKMPFNRFNLTVAGVDEFVIPVMFGRYLGDPEYALDPNRFANLQLKVTFDEDACSTAVVVNEFQIDALTIPPNYAGSVKGFLSSKDVKTYAMAASAHNETILPNDFPLYGILYQADTVDHDVTDLVDVFKIDLNNNADVLYNETFCHYWRQYIAQNYAPVIEAHILDTAITAKVMFANTRQNNHGDVGYDDTAVTAAGELCECIFLGHFLNTAASVAVLGETIQIQGEIPHGVFPFPFMGNDMRPYWSINSRDTLRMDVLSLAAADAGDTGVISAIQVVPNS